MKAKLIRRTGETKEMSLFFCWGYFFFGPLYFLFHGLFFRFLVLILIYAFGLWKNAGLKMIEIVQSLGVNEEFVSFLKVPGKHYYITLGVIVGIHVLMCFISSKLVTKVLLRKKGFIPYSEIDAQLLVKHSLVKVGTKSYLSNFKSIRGVQGKIKIENTEELNKKLDELAELLKSGMITKDEYNTKRAQALMNVASKK